MGRFEVVGKGKITGNKDINNRFTIVDSPTTTTTAPPTEEIKDIWLRAKMGFASTPEGEESVVRQKYKDVIRGPEGNLQVKPEGGEQYKYVNKPGFTAMDLPGQAGLVPEMVGGGIGEALGAMSPVWGGAAIGGGVGTAAGKGAQMGIGQLLGIEESPDIPKELKKSFVAGTAGTAGGRAATKLLAPFAKTVKEGAKRGAGKLAEYGGRMMPEQMTQHKGLDWIAGTVRGAFGGGKVTRQDVANEAAIEAWGNDLINKLGSNMNKYDVGTAVDDVISKGTKTFKNTADALFSEMDKLTSGMGVSTKRMKAAANSLMSRYKMPVTTKKTVETGILSASGEPITKEVTEKTTKELLKSAQSKTTRGIVKDILALPDEIPWSMAQELRSDLLSVGYQTGEAIAKKAPAEAKFLASAVDSSMSKSAKEIGPEAFDAWRKANKFWKDGSEKFNNKFINAIMDSRKSASFSPDKIVDMTFKRNNTANILKLKAVTDKKTWNELQSTYLSEVIDASTKDTAVVGKNMEKQLNKLGEKGLKAVFGDNLADIKTFVNTVKMVQDKGLATKSDVLIQLTQGGALMNVASAPFTGGGGLAGLVPSGAILLSPWVVAKIMTNKMGIKWLTEGLVTRVGTKEAIKIAARLGALEGKERAKSSGAERGY